MRIAKWTLAVAVATVALPVVAAGQPEPWQLGLQAPVGALAEYASRFHGFVLWIILALGAGMLALLGYVMWRFHETRNPTPSQTADSGLLEVGMTVIPFLVLAMIVMPSMRLLYAYDRADVAEITIKATGHQWYWRYEYPDHGDFSFDAQMLADDALTPGQPRLLAANENLVLPVDTAVRVLVTASDVIHAWAVPAFFVKADAIPGRINKLLIAPVSEPGMYYGQCSELCGRDHAFMPIAVKIVSKPDFDEWVTQAQARFARVIEDIEPPLRLARAPAARLGENPQ